MICRKQNHASHVFVRVSLLCLFLAGSQMVGMDVGAKGASLDTWKRHAITNLPDRAIYILGADVDGDGKQDLVAGAW